MDGFGKPKLDENNITLKIRVPVEPNFRTSMLNHDDPDNTDESIDKLVKVWYFAITTLSTIGYGDYSPVSTQERLVASAILMFGVAVEY